MVSAPALPLTLTDLIQLIADLVSVVSIRVAILKSSSEELLVRVTISQPRVVVLCRVAICATPRRIIAATTTIVSASLITFVVAGIQRRLPKFI